MSTSYYIFTEVKVNGEWHCINGKITRLMPIEHPIIAPTFHTDARRYFEKAYQYYEWNDRSGAYRYYDEIHKEVAAQLRDWKTVNPGKVIEDIRIVMFTS